jgi:aquaporin Z
MSEPDRDRSARSPQPVDEIRNPDWPRRLTAEVFGTFALVFVAAGGDVMAKVSHDEVTAAARAVAPALMVMALIYSVGDRSGAHFNPAVTLAFALKRLVPPAWLAPYWAAQLVGAIVAAWVVRGLFGEAIAAGVSAPKLVDARTALAVEAILTLLLASVILGTADRFRVVGPNAALAVGGTIALCGLIALPVEGASMNPARSFGPALVAGQLADLPVYVLGPVLGAIGAVLLTRFLHGEQALDHNAREAAQGEPQEQIG